MFVLYSILIILYLLCSFIHSRNKLSIDMANLFEEDFDYEKSYLLKIIIDSFQIIICLIGIALIILHLCS